MLLAVLHARPPIPPLKMLSILLLLVNDVTGDD
jgi:hypothetical protein